MADDDALAGGASDQGKKKQRTISPIVFFDREEMPNGMMDLRVKPVTVRPTVPPVVEEEPETESLVAPAAANPEPPITEPEPTLFDEPMAKHPSRLPAKD